MQGPPLGGLLYGKLGWKAPLTFAMILGAFEIALRLSILETRRLSASCRENISPNRNDLRPWTVLWKLISSARGMTATALCCIYGFVIGVYDPM